MLLLQMLSVQGVPMVFTQRELGWASTDPRDPSDQYTGIWTDGWLLLLSVFLSFSSI